MSRRDNPRLGSPRRVPGRATRRLQLGATLAIASFAAAATPGDIGGCGAPVADLDPESFFAIKRSFDCSACGDCGIDTDACERACTSTELPTEFPTGCFPLTHDGAVCLRALEHAPCSDYRRFMADSNPEAPSECNFCPPQLEPQGLGDD